MEDFIDFVMIFVVPFLVLLVFVAGIVLGLRAWTHNVEVAGCAAFSSAAGRDTKFVDYTFWTWDCLTPVQDGTWVSVSNLRGQEAS